MLDRDGLIAKLAPEWYAEWLNTSFEEQMRRAEEALGEEELDATPEWNRMTGKIMARELEHVASAAIIELRRIDAEATNRR